MQKSTALLTDRYELTMVQAARSSGLGSRECVFETFSRQLPAGRRYGVVAGTGRLLEELPKFRFHESELTWLAEANVVDSATIDFLADFKFTGNIWGYREGDAYFAYSPVIVVEAPFEQGVLLETMILSIMNYDSAVASAASRMRTAAGDRYLAEMGGRRTNEQSAVAAARAAFIAGFDATSNLEAGRSWGIPTMGTAAHAFTLLHNSETDAFRAQVATFGTGTTLLVDTYNTDEGVRKAIEVAGTDLGAVRIDSGDLGVEVTRVRALLDSLGATKTKITVTNDLDEHAIASLAAAPVDNYGVGTSVVTGSGVPTAGFVYKLVAHRDDQENWVSVSKRSTNKTNMGGRKQALRQIESGIATKELLAAGHEVPVGRNVRELLVPLVSEGEIREEFTGSASVVSAREVHRSAMAELPIQAHRLQRGNTALPTEFI
ncbi:MAG: nicotinate phosphoribosyltransferase [Rhodoluna sp.]|nr:nicotinate phosphoribosyltransferase [Rhodoluna sp.]